MHLSGHLQYPGLRADNLQAPTLTRHAKYATDLTSAYGISIVERVQGCMVISLFETPTYVGSLMLMGTLLWLNRCCIA